MKQWIGLMALVTAANSASATLLYDPFNYTTAHLDGNTAPNGQPWAMTGPATGGLVQIASGSLLQGTTANASYNALPVPTGNSISNLNVSVGERVALGNNQAINSGNVYYSLGLNVSALSSLTTAGIFLCGFNNVAGTQTTEPTTVGSRLYVRKDTDGTDYDIGLAKDAGPNAYTYWYPTALNLNKTYFVVGGYSVVGSLEGTDDISDLWVNPDPSTFAQSTTPAATLEVNPQVIFPNDTTDQNTSLGKDVGTGTVGDPASAEAVVTFSLRTNTALPTMSVDELRIDTTWAGVTAVEWEAAANGNWSSSGNWSNKTAFPNAIGADVTFGTNSTGYNVNLDQPMTVGTLRFNGTNSYTIGGSSTLTIQEAPNTGIANPAQIIVSAGSHSITAPVQINKDLALNIASGSTITLSGGVTTASGISLTLGGSTISGGNAVIKPAGAASMQGLKGLTIAAGNLTLSPAHAAVTTAAFSLASASTLNLTNNDLVVDYAPNAGNTTGSDTTTGPAVVAAVLAADDNGLWDKPGITTSMAPAGSGKTLAVVDNEALTTPLSTDGLTLDASSVIVKYTWFGDLNLDGTVDSSDLSLMGDGQTGWAGGDLNYDGAVNQDDYALFQLGAAQSAGRNISVTPEPSAALVTAIMGMIAIRRRKGTCQ